MDPFVKKAIKLTSIIAVLIVLGLGVFKKISWAEGFLIAVIWSILNYLLTMNLFQMGLLKEDKTKLFLMLLIKFPVLYLFGFFILVSRLFPVSSLLSGLPLILVVIGVSQLCHK